MKRLVSQLPPLKSLVAFEAVMRLGTVTAAAKELTSTQPSVSQHIKWLENNLDTPLFVKSGRQLKPTPEAQQYFATIQNALNSIADSSQTLRQRQTEPTVQIVAHTGLASLWLLPHLPTLKTAFPDIAINVMLSDNDDGQADAQVIQLQFGQLKQQVTTLPLFTESVCIVAGSEYAKQHGLGRHTRLTHVLTHPLIHMDDRDSRWLNWRLFLAHHGCRLPNDRDKILLGNYHSVVSQARRNSGLALGWIGIIDELLDSGELVRVTDIELSRPDYGYFIDTNGLNQNSLAVAKVLQQLAANERS